MLKFKCEECDSEEVVEIESNCTSNRLVSFDGKSLITYGKQFDTNEDYTTTSYECYHCGEVLEGVTDEDELIEYLKENQ